MACPHENQSGIVQTNLLMDLKRICQILECDIVTLSKNCKHLKVGISYASLSSLPGHSKSQLLRRRSQGRGRSIMEAHIYGLLKPLFKIDYTLSIDY